MRESEKWQSIPTWLLTFIGTFIVAVFSIWLGNMSKEMSGFTQGATERATKIAGLEAGQTYINEKIAVVDRKMDIMINKLDAHMTKDK
jgi:hypothetical protein